MKLRFVLCLFWIIIAVCNAAVMFWMAVCIMFNIDRATQIALGYDRVGNVAMGRGWETISSWAGRNNDWLERPINWLFKVLTGEENHCDRWKEK
jgi:hypothetical protein